jgi:hypothetical protein
MNAAVELIERLPRREMKAAPKNLLATYRFYYQAGRNGAHRDELMMKARRETDLRHRKWLVASARFHNHAAINFLAMAREYQALRDAQVIA